jgi:hypothetical protein
MHSENFFTPSFLRAIKANTAASFRSIMAEPSRGIYTFEMLQPQFCEMLVSEVSHSFSFLFMHISIHMFYISICFLIRF